MIAAFISALHAVAAVVFAFTLLALAMIILSAWPMTNQIPIPRRGGPLDGVPFKCFKSVYDYLHEGQLFSAYHRVSLYTERLRVEEVTYRLCKNSKGDWELLYLP